MIPRIQRLTIIHAWLFLLLALAAPALLAQGKHHAKDAAPAETNATALMISDLHFDPFHDPGKAQQLARTPVGQWESVLESPPSPDQAQAFDDLQKKCGARGVDTPYPLLLAAFQGMHAQQANPDFITITGDLIAHKFDCRYKATVSSPTPQAYSEFVVNTIAFVVHQLRGTYPGVPIYISLGNNDSDCGDYRLDPQDPMLTRAASAIGEALPPSERRHAEAEFTTGGYYSVTMAPPMLDTRIIVLNDIFFAPNYKSCSGDPSPAPAAAEIAWLSQTLAQAHENGQNVWVIGHIPPGVNVYATMKSMANVCGGGSASMFMDSAKIDGLLTQYSDIVRLGLFAHTHMDEIRLVAPDGAGPDQGVPLKLVPSISPVDGNKPSFTIAKVEPSTATVKDFDVFVGSNQTGQGITWTEDYDFDRAFGQTTFTAASVAGVINQFRADPKAQTGASQQYIRSYFKGEATRELAPFWPQYTCSLANTTAASYKSCVCGGGK